MSKPLLQRINADQSTEFNGMEVSFGIAPILATISDMFQQTHKPPIDAFIINVETIVRDRMKTITKDTVLALIADKVLSDIIVMIHYISTYNRLSQDTNKVTPHIFVYFANYSKGIPRLYLRDKLPKYTVERWHVVDLVIQRLKKKGAMSECNGTTVKWCMAGSTRAWPHMELSNDIQSCMRNRYLTGYMVSHAPIDFHLHSHFKEFSIIESYTGKRKTPDEFGKKVFTISDDIPFNKYTHLLLGDKWLINCTLKPAEKNKVKDLAISKKWYLKPDNLILKDLHQSGIINTDYLTKPRI